MMGLGRVLLNKKTVDVVNNNNFTTDNSKNKHAGTSLPRPIILFGCVFGRWRL